ncbi:hypothetical protein Cch01nite_35910 [Cellulomonas chitinilytica]|uniref:DUF488 family protein n=1 Tax=Cellulomonas chitinilytica TaxID=398759 RepID=A0A919U3X3_9CELL|nr:DUF488 family protein [Cellulomonas chitinilytica]GIG22867.1 hypothetical protein Cch01nite_35910 [Cellulomonas chitinilytica]
MGSIRAARVYDRPGPDDGRRVLVDRLWPRGLRKEEAHLDEWPKELTPSTELRQWYHAHPDGYEEFRQRYLVELGSTEAAVALDGLRALATDEDLTLLSATRSLDASHVTVLLEVLGSSGA